jgi:hypothetical protein
MTENELWLDAWLDRWGGALARLAILFGAGSLVAGWLQGGVL